ncbi:NUDIX hydrolase [Streptomyces yangpuensis]|uniref:NUDIX hydrolase n=1 Tax=Streptomyces yangpuensis TaxID=1648182 RepID=UPI0036626F67
MTNTEIAALLPLQQLINQIVRATPIGATDRLAAELAVQTAVWVGKNVLPATPGLAPFVADVDAERGRQLQKWGDQRHRDGTSSGNASWAQEALAQCQHAADEDALTWGHILYEEFTEVMAETDPTRLRAELIQVAAVCAAWVSDLDRRTADCPSCEVGIEHTVHCPTPETHNWGCGCPTDEMPVAAQREDPS